MGYIGVHLGVLALAFFLRSFPAVLVVFFVAAMIMAVVAAPLSNVWDEVAADPTFVNERPALPKMDFLMSNLPKFEILWLFITGIVMAGLSRND